MPTINLQAMTDADIHALKDACCQELAQRYDRLEQKLAAVEYRDEKQERVYCYA